jgi:hypothetical protein
MATGSPRLGVKRTGSKDLRLVTVLGVRPETTNAQKLLILGLL